jgi:hypothetical protein
MPETKFQDPLVSLAGFLAGFLLRLWARIDVAPCMRKLRCATVPNLGLIGTAQMTKRAELGQTWNLLKSVKGNPSAALCPSRRDGSAEGRNSQ